MLTHLINSVLYYLFLSFYAFLPKIKILIHLIIIYFLFVNFYIPIINVLDLYCALVAFKEFYFTKQIFNLLIIQL